ncbi:MAG: C39 family peptidase [Anaerolineales bacterium]|nr:C39 family peptidase [Anaerolineales bacterium]
MPRTFKRLILTLITVALAALLLYQLPPIKSRLEWRLANVRAQVWRMIFPPEDAVFVPNVNPTPTESAAASTEIAQQVAATLEALLTPSPFPLFTPSPSPTSLPPNTSTPTLTPTLIPATVLLPGIRHEYEQWNNCGPATLGMQLSFWGWQGNQSNTAPFLKPNPRDKNVSPEELVAYVETQTGYHALLRAGGTLDLLKNLIAAGFPTIVEKTLDVPGVDGWIGHYTLVSGYDDTQSRFITQDSYIMAGFPEPYDKLYTAWQSFNYTFMVVYPPEREAELMQVLGSLSDPAISYQLAATRADEQIASTTGQAQFFAWYNKGSSLVGLGDYVGAAAAYDAAFALYPQLPLEERPWRMTWYQFGPYQAYFETGRYQDVVDLAIVTLYPMDEQTVEETFYWRALAKEKLGDLKGALEDMQRAVDLNANYTAAADALKRLKGG